MFIKAVAVLAAVTLAAPFAASAATFQDGSYAVENYNGTRGIWSPSLLDGANKLWSVSDSAFVINGNSASMTGTATNIQDNELTFTYSLSFARTAQSSGFCQFSGGHDLGCVNEASYTGADKVDPSSWDYFDLLAGGTFSGTGAMAGLEWTITDKTKSNGVANHPPQAGVGANALERGDVGFSMWYFATRSDASNVSGVTTTNGHYSVGAFGTRKSGDINVDLGFGSIGPDGKISPVPLPAAAWMLLAAVGGLGVAGRRRKA